MFRTFVNSFKVSFAENANTFIYFIKRAPLTGKIIPEKLYRMTTAKLVLGIIYEIMGIAGGFFRKALYLAVMIILPSYLIKNDIKQLLPVFLHIFFFLSIISGSLMNIVIFSINDKTAFDMIILMRSDAREYYIGKLIYMKLTDFVYFTVPMVIIGLIIGLSPLKAVMLTLELTALRFIGEWLHLFVYDKTGKILLNKNSFAVILVVCGLVLAYALPVSGINLDFRNILFHSYAFIAVISLGAAAFIYIWKYKGYNLIAKMLLTRDNIFNKEAFIDELKFADVKIDEKKIRMEDLNSKKYDEIQGYEYLNSLFFLRHKRIMVTPIKIRVAIIGVLFLMGMYIVIFMPDRNKELVQFIPRSTPMFVFIMYSMSTGERICRAMFYNCDSSLLRYSYYREGKVILSNFTSRLKRAVILNIIPASALCFALAAITAASGYGLQLISMTPLFLCILCLSCFFSIHHLCLYYVIQPYTAELTIKSPLFKFVNLVVYVLSYMCLQIKTYSYYFTSGVLAATVLYMAAALILTYKVAPKTFKLK